MNHDGVLHGRVPAGLEVQGAQDGEGISTGQVRGRIGMLTVGLGGAYVNALVQGAEDFARTAGLDLIIYELDGFEALDAEAGTYSLVRADLVDGIILTGGLAYRGVGAQEVLAGFRARCGVPLVTTSRWPWMEGVASVVPDSYTGMREVVEHLIDVHGHRRIGFIKGPAESQEAQDRYRAFEDALMSRGLRVNPELVAEGEFSHESGQRAMIELLDRVSADEVEAMVCSSDGIALGVLDVLRERGLQVPEDMALVGFDDAEAASRLPVPLTTVRQPVHEIGYGAAAALWALVKDAGKARAPQARQQTEVELAAVQVVPTRAVIRQSCGCLPSEVVRAVLPSAVDAVASSVTAELEQPLSDADPYSEEERRRIVAALRAAIETAGTTETSAATPSLQVGPAAGSVDGAESDLVALVDAFWTDIRSPESATFVSMLTRLIRTFEDDAWDWHEVISVLRRAVLPSLDDGRQRTRAEDLLQQGRALVGEMQLRLQAHRQQQAEQFETTLRVFGDQVANLVSMEAALPWLEQALPNLGVTGCALALLMDLAPSGPEEPWIQLQYLAMGGSRLVWDDDGPQYPLAEVLPAEAWGENQERRTLVILPLQVSDRALGLVAFEGDLAYAEVYPRLRQALSGVVFRTGLARAQVTAREDAEAATRRAEVALRDALVAQRRYVAGAWEGTALEGSGVHGYARMPEGEGVTGDAWLPGMTRAVETGRVVVERDDEGGEVLAVPLRLYGEGVVGTLGFWRETLDGDARSSARSQSAGTKGRDGVQQSAEGPAAGVRDHGGWTAEQIRLVENVANQMALALENQRLVSDTRRRAARLSAAAEVSAAATSITDLETLLSEAVTLIQDRFELYYAGLFLVDQNRQWAVLVAGTGEAGRVMLARGHRLEVGGQSMIGACVASGEARITFDAALEAVRRENPLLPATRSELALPLRSRGEVIGAMTIQDTHPGAFTEEDITTLQTMADQLANAIENARLLEQAARSLREVQLATGAYTQVSWREYLQEQPDVRGYRYRLVDVVPVDEARPEAQAAMTQGAVVVQRSEDGGTGEDRSQPSEGQPQRESGGGRVEAKSVAQTVSSREKPLTAAQAPEPALDSEDGVHEVGVGVPIRLRNQILGALNLRFDGDYVAPEVVQMVEQVADRLAVSLESARLLEETRRAALRERMVGEVSRRIRQSLEVDEVLQAAAREIRDAMDYYRVSIRLAPQDGAEGTRSEAGPNGGETDSGSRKAGPSSGEADPGSEDMAASSGEFDHSAEKPSSPGQETTGDNVDAGEGGSL